MIMCCGTSLTCRYAVVAALPIVPDQRVMRLRRAYVSIDDFCRSVIKDGELTAPIVRIDVGVHFENKTKEDMKSDGWWPAGIDGLKCFTLSNITTQLDMELHSVGAARR